MDCPLCSLPSSDIVWEDDLCRVIRVDDEHYGGFCRVVWREHVAEMTDLLPADRAHLFDVVMATESALRTLLNPDKINLASLGNQVPHLHWHVIARFHNDRHFPQPIWGTAQREGEVRPPVDVVELARAIEGALPAHSHD